MWRWARSWLFVDAGEIVRAGRDRPLSAADAPPLACELEPRAASAAFDALAYQPFWPFVVRLFFGTGRPARRLLGLTFVRLAIALSAPVLLHAVLARLPAAHAAPGFPFALLGLALLLGLAGISSALLTQHWYHQALQARTVLVNAINRRVVAHALRLRRSARAKMGTGDLVNHLGSDTDALAETGFYLPEAFHAALTIVAAFTALAFYLGWAALAALGSLAVIAPLTWMLGARFRRLDQQIMGIRDERTTLMSQLLHGIRVVKLHAWEPSMRAEVRAVRQRELRTKVSILSTDVLASAFWVSTSTLVAFAGFGAFVLLGGKLSAPLVFSCLALFVMLEEPFGLISHILARVQHARVAASRLHEYFCARARDEDLRELSAPEQPLALHACDVAVRYDGAPTCALQDVSLEIAAGASVAIVGAVGSGKSTLLRVLAGIQVPTSGSAACAAQARPRLAYVPQEAFILNASVRDNIVFGADQSESPDEQALASIVDDCALSMDLAAMPAGLDTEIGERGVNLSGGQKQRVALARAVHHRPGVVLLDDPLSAVDVHTEDILAQRLLFGRWRGVTRIVATHRLAHLPRFDHVVLLVDGRIAAQGSYPELMRSNAAFRAFADSAESGRSAVDARAASHAAPRSGQAERAVVEGQGRVTADEDRETGAVRWPVYRDYVRAMLGSGRVLGPLILGALIASVVVVAVLPVSQRIFLGRFTDHTVSLRPLSAVAAYGALGLVVLACSLLQKFLWLYRAAAAGRSLHDQALDGVLGASLRFFDSTPTGRILNRFASDLEAVDDELAWSFEQTGRTIASTLASVVVIVTVIPALLLVTLPVLIAYGRLQRDYRIAAREAKRLESVARSPRYAHFKEVVTGLDVIHGFGRERFFMERFYAILEHFQRMAWCSIKLNRWFGVRVPLWSGLVALGTSIAVVLLARAGSLGGGLAGVVLTYSLGLWGALNWTVRAMSQVEATMTSAERLQYYARLPPEPLTTAEPLAESAEWPVRGSVEFRELSARYAPHLPRVLHGVSFRAEGGTKVGVVGRTGAGKSSLFQALFRLIEPEHGAIFVDGVNLASVPLPRLRRAIAIIPQDPTLFAGTIRGNLDRFTACSDEQLWTALRRVRLDTLIRSLPGQLDAPVAEHGHNLSQGQRQLLCLGRAILARARIVVLDEATASVDVHTDRLIQDTVRHELAGVTVLVIAHRLDTVARADQVVELADGRVVQQAVALTP
jgi:ABC-type multidrug transport system fused ATPase/permease subunit